MKKFLLVITGFIAAIVLLVHIGPIILLGVSVWLLYLIFKQFMKTESTTKKIMWIVLGLVVLSISISNMYAILGIAAAYVLYLVVKHWKKDEPIFNKESNDDPLMNFEEQWGEFK